MVDAIERGIALIGVPGGLALYALTITTVVVIVAAGAPQIAATSRHRRVRWVLGLGLAQLGLAAVWLFAFIVVSWGFFDANTPADQLPRNTQLWLFLVAPIGFLALGSALWAATGLPRWLAPAASAASCIATVIIVGTLRGWLMWCYPVLIWLALPVATARNLESGAIGRSFWNELWNGRVSHDNDEV